MKVAAALIALTLATGCASSPYRDQVMDNPNTTPFVKSMIAQGEISTHMTKLEVLASWGEPCWVCYGTRESSHGSSWEYKSVFAPGIGRLIYFDNNDRVDYWSGK